MKRRKRKRRSKWDVQPTPAIPQRHDADRWVRWWGRAVPLVFVVEGPLPAIVWRYSLSELRSDIPRLQRALSHDLSEFKR